MADGLNRVTLLGNLGADPELRHTRDGVAALNLRLATTESYLDRDKVRKERTDWHAVTVWGKRGEALASILRKGSQLLVEGSLRTSSYEKDGEKRYKTEVNATNVVLCGGRGEGERREAPRYGTTGHGANAKHTGTPEGDDLGGLGEDDIPW